MTLLFEGTAGNVVQFDDPSAQCTVSSRQLLDLKPPIDFNTYRAIITRVTVSQKVNLQFLHTLGSMVYVYVFGDRMGGITLSGLSFYMCPCPDTLTLSQQDVYSWYKANRASKRSDPVKITVGAATITGFVTEFSEDVVDPSMNLMQWGVGLMALPDEE